jgi:hypothetical protein
LEAESKSEAGYTTSATSFSTSAAIDNPVQAHTGDQIAAVSAAKAIIASSRK